MWTVKPEEANPIQTGRAVSIVSATRGPEGERPAAPLAVVENWVRLPAGPPVFRRRDSINGNAPALKAEGAHVDAWA